MSFLRSIISKYAVTAVAVSDGAKQYIPASNTGWRSAEVTERNLQLLEKAIADKSIYNVKFQEAKEQLSRSYDNFRERVWQKNHASNYPYSLVHFPGFVKKLKGEKPTEEMLWWVSVANLIAEAKPFIQKGRAPNPNAPKKFVPPKSAKEDLAKIDKAIKDLLKDWYPKQVEIVYDSFVRNAKAYKKAKEDGSYAKAHPMVRKMLDVGSPFVKRNEKDVLELLPEAKLKEMAEAETKRIQDHFLEKQMSKLTSIVSRKGKLKDVSIEDARARSGVLEATLKFVFDNKDEFEVLNQVIYKTSSQGKPFAQFPTTFHDVKLGSKSFKKVSEEWMNSTFIESPESADNN